MGVNDDGILPLTSEPEIDQVETLNPFSEQSQKDKFKSDLTGSVFINGQSSYSGADIKVVVHVYDNGKAARERKEILDKQIQELNQTTEQVRGELNRLSTDLNEPDAVFSSNEVNRLNSLNKQLVISENTLGSLKEELDRLSTLEPRVSTKVLAELQTISVSTHREKYPVRALGGVYPRAYTRNQRTIAGSMIFTVFDKNVLEEFLEAHPSDFDAHNPVTSALLDQIPPFDITIAFANELGQVSRMAIYGVEFVNEGQTMSIEDIFLENTVQYVARDIDPMRIVSQRKVDENMRMVQEIKPLSASSLLTEDDYDDYKRKLSPYERFKHRRSPFT